ncbi:peptidase P60, partial [Caulobacter sp.]|uniref:peptidase P60 n=1 Tax=Caulobacter sp. TaxID=78 RepID=UPI003BAF6600
GCDCLGLVRGVWRALYGDEPQPLPPYGPDWAEIGGEERLGAALGRWLTAIAVDQAQPGDVLTFRLTPTSVAKHCAILSAPAPDARIVHAYWGRACVESWLGPWWRSRLAGAFAFPGRDERRLTPLS